MRSVLARVSGTCLAFLWSTVAPCQGGIGDVPDRVGIGQATRIIFNEKDASLSFPVRNGSDSPYLLRTYIVNPQTQTTAKQLYVAPEVLRLSSHSTQSCRIVRLTNDFRSDRESLFFLRGLFIPASYDRAPKDSRTTSASFTDRALWRTVTGRHWPPRPWLLRAAGTLSDAVTRLRIT